MKQGKNILSLLPLVIISILLSCTGRKAPPWTIQDITIEQGKIDKGYVTESVGLKPSESLAQLKCMTQGKIKLQNVVRGKIEEKFKEFLNYTKNIEPYREKVKIFREMMVEISKEIIKKLSDKIEQEGIHIDKENYVLFCRMSLKFDEEFYRVLEETSIDIMKTNYYRTIYDEEAPKKLMEYVEENIRKIKGGKK